VSRKKSVTGLRPISVLLRQLQNAMRQAMEEALQEAELTGAQANALTELAYGPARSNAELARAGHVTPQTMIEILMSLECKGFLVRKAQSEGGRAMLAELTGEGRRKLLSVHLAMRAVERRLLQALSAEDVSRMRQLLEQCLAGLETGSTGRELPASLIGERQKS
jgi:DNA-binding MarR family transcriptional regulator